MVQNVNTVTLGGTASNVTVGKVAHGLMGLNVVSPPVPDEQAFEAIKAGVDALPSGAKMLLNSGEFYSTDLGTGNLELLARFYEKYPAYADKTFLSVKGGLKHKSFEPDASPANLRRSIDNVVATLRGTKRVDLFEAARVDPKVPIEDTITMLAGFVNDGLFDHVGLSECSADTLRRANKVHPIVAAEIEVSPWSYEEETRKVIAACRELGIAVVAYSPLGNGFLTGAIKSTADLAENDLRRRFSRFQEDSIKHNIAIVDALTAIADKKHVSPAQLSIAWVAALGPHMIPLPGSSHAKRTLENCAAGDVALTAEDLAAIDRVITTHQVKGARYFDVDPKTLYLWG